MNDGVSKGKLKIYYKVECAEISVESMLDAVSIIQKYIGEIEGF